MVKTKKALSPAVAKVLLIFFVILVVIIIFIWLMGFFSESVLKFNAPVEESCSKIRFRATLARSETIGYPQLQISNTGSIQIFDFSLKYIRSNKQSETGYVGRSLDPGIALSIDLIPGTVETVEIQVFPIILGSTKSNKNKQKICFDNSQSIKLQQVNP